MDLDKLKQQWKSEEDMHPSMPFNEQQIDKAIQQSLRNVSWAWLYPVLMITGMFIILFTVDWGQPMPTKSYFGIGIISLFILYNGYSLLRLIRDTITLPVQQHLSYLQKRFQWLRHYFGATALFMILFGASSLILSNDSWEVYLKNSYLIWLYALVFIVLSYRYYQQYADIGDRDVSHEQLAQQLAKEQQVRVKRFKFLIPIVTITIGALLIAYALGYDQSYILGIALGLAVGLGSMLYEYWKLK